MQDYIIRFILDQLFSKENIEAAKRELLKKLRDKAKETPSPFDDRAVDLLEKIL